MLYIMRHGKTDWNEQQKLQGSVDVPLNDTGIAMAKEAKEKYKDIHFDVCYCSPMQRARQTAQIFLEGTQIPVVYDDRLREMRFGDFEGTKDVLSLKEGPMFYLFHEPGLYKGGNGAETFDELYNRTGEFIEKIIKPELEKGKDIVIIGHGAMNASIINQFKNIPREDFWREGRSNCKLIRLV